MSGTARIVGAARPCLVVAAAACIASAALSEEVEPSPGMRGEVLDLRYAVEDIGGGVVDLAGEETEQEVRYSLAGDVLFAFDRATIRPDAEAVLAKLAEEIRTRFPGAPVRVEGHTDARGSEAYNRELSRRRAEAVRSWLVQEGGVDAGRIETRGFGETRPVAPNATPDGRDDPAGRQKNRRVEVVVQKR